MLHINVNIIGLFERCYNKCMYGTLSFLILVKQNISYADI